MNISKVNNVQLSAGKIESKPVSNIKNEEKNIVSVPAKNNKLGKAEILIKLEKYSSMLNDNNLSNDKKIEIKKAMTFLKDELRSDEVKPKTLDIKQS